MSAQVIKVNHYTKWNNQWVIKGYGPTPSVGDTLIVSKADGSFNRDTVTAIAMEGIDHDNNNETVWLAVK